MFEVSTDEIKHTEHCRRTEYKNATDAITVRSMSDGSGYAVDCASCGEPIASILIDEFRFHF